MTTIHFDNIIQTAGTQFRVETCLDNIEVMKDLIERKIEFKSKMRLARWNDSLYLVDGFHRMAAFLELGQLEFDEDMFVIVDAQSIEEVRTLAAGANVGHGKSNTQADYHNIIIRLMELGDTYMKNAFEPDINKMTTAIGASLPKMKRGYADYQGTAQKPHPSLSQQCKDKRDRAVLEFHKMGKSQREIATLCKMPSHHTVMRILEDHAVQNAETAKCTTTIPQAPVLTQASTAHREDAVQPDVLSDDEYDEQFLNMTDEELNKEFTPYDVLARTGFKADDARKQKRDASNDSVHLEVKPVQQDKFAMMSERDRLAAEVAEDEARLAAKKARLAALDELLAA